MIEIEIDRQEMVDVLELLKETMWGYVRFILDNKYLHIYALHHNYQREIIISIPLSKKTKILNNDGLSSMPVIGLSDDLDDINVKNINSNFTLKMDGANSYLSYTTKKRKNQAVPLSIGDINHPIKKDPDKFFGYPLVAKYDVKLFRTIDMAGIWKMELRTNRIEMYNKHNDSRTHYARGSGEGEYFIDMSEVRLYIEDTMEQITGIEVHANSRGVALFTGEWKGKILSIGFPIWS